MKVRNSLFSLTAWWFLWLLPVLPLPISAEEQQVIDIGGRRELFVDDHLIQRLDNARLRLHRPTPREVTFVFDKPWEGNESFYMTVFRDNGRYRMYYRGRQVVYDEKGLHVTHPEVVCYADSTNGIDW